MSNRIHAVPIVLAVLVVASRAWSEDRITGRTFATRSEVIATNGMAATSQPLATQVALDILKQGGNAIDAAIAANATLGLMEPTGNGIGGDLFAMVWDAKTQRLYGLNASGRSPKSLSMEEFRKRELKTIPAFGPLPVSVPGCVDGWFELHAKFGSRKMSEILAPAVGYARDGFPVSELIAHYWARSEKLKKYPGFEATFLPNGKAPKKGELFRNPMLAKTLESIGREGRDLFYKGEYARRIGEFMKAHDGFLAYEDMAAHRSEWSRHRGASDSGRSPAT
jgi:gamma-glutamyltranspeptidase/glutathione hydrolase